MRITSGTTAPAQKKATAPTEGKALIEAGAILDFTQKGVEGSKRRIYRLEIVAQILSPDGLVGENGAIEVKGPLTTTHLQTLVIEAIAKGEIPHIVIQY